MSNLSLKSIKFKAFRSFVEEQELSDLPENGLIAIKGPSGAGKSSLHQTISYALGCASFPETEMQSLLTKDRIQVELNLKCDNDDIIIKRGKELSFAKNGQIIKGAAKLVETEIQKLIKVPIELLETVTYREQGSVNKFLAMTDSKKKEFLSSLLSLNEIEDRIKESSKICSILEKAVHEYKYKMESLSPFLVKPDLGLLIDLNSIKNKIEERKAFLNDINYQLKPIKEQIDGLVVNLNEYEVYLEKLKKEEISNLDTHNEELNNKEKIFNEFQILFHNKQRECDKLKIKQSDLLLEINKESEYRKHLSALELKRCYTCGQEWHNLNEIDKIKVKLNDISDKRNQFNELNRQIDVLVLERKELFDKSDRLLAEINSFDSPYRLEYNNIQEKYQKLYKDKQLEIAKVLKDLQYKEQPLVDKINWLNKEINDFKNELIIGESKNQTKKDGYSASLAYHNKMLAEYESLNKSYQEKDKLYKEELDFIGLCKGFLGAIFEEVLNEISQEINGIIESIPNVSNVTVRFDTEKLNKNETIKQEIKLIVLKNGLPMSFRMLSGGQQSAIELATDLALNSVISRRMGIKMGYMILDEAFDGLTVNDKEICLEILKTAAQDKLIFVIDHSTEVKEYFDRFINISIDNNGYSRTET